MMERRASAWIAILAGVGACALVGCGGHVAGIGDDDTGTDSGVVDSGPGEDTGPGYDTGYWDSYSDVPCTTESPCVDSGGYCPGVLPPIGSPCSGSAYCTYPTKCGSESVACVGGVWVGEGGVDSGCGGTCPAYPPAGGLPCSDEGLGCGYSTCPDGSVNVKAICTGGRWSVDTAPCSSPGCPTYEPSLGAPCDPGAGKCTYANGCGGHDYLYCGPGGWASAGSDCSTPTCPSFEPSIGSYCGTTALKCDYPNSCGGRDYVYCDGTGGGWASAGSTCTPPPPTCPTYEPKPGTSCTPPQKCTYPNSCGGTDFVSCPPWGTWSLDGTSCSGPSCPPYEPITGSSCAGFPGGTTCNYPPGAACPQPCVCGADGRWTCYTVLCDAGPPPPSPCDDGFPCAPGTGCATPCYKSCACGPDGIYHCTPSPCADAGGI